MWYDEELRNFTLRGQHAVEINDGQAHESSVRRLVHSRRAAGRDNWQEGNNLLVGGRLAIDIRDQEVLRAHLHRLS